MTSISNIIKAYVIAHSPTHEQQLLANSRGYICNTCELKTTRFGIIVCGGCGCPIAKKIFTPEHNPCPELKWKKIDDEFFNPTKKNKTII